MVDRSSLHGDMAAIIRDALLPQRFPIRRDVELGAAVAHSKEAVSFYDHMWIGRQTLAVAAIQIDGSGVDVALKAASFRQLLRAALTVLGDPCKALSECMETASASGLDAAIVLLDTNGAVMKSATVGDASVGVVGHAQGDGYLSVGDVVWISAGNVSPPESSDIPIEGLDHLARDRVDRGGGGSAVALLFRARALPGKSATFVVPNDAHAIPPLLAQVATFFSQHAIPQECTGGIDVAIDEILTNAISYAFSDGKAHEIYLQLLVETDKLVIEIRDDGTPFDPLGVAPPNLSDDIEARQVGGLGMHFVRTIMDTVDYRRESGWNILTLSKLLAQAKLQGAET